MRKSDDDDETDIMLEGLLDVVPDLPITEEKLNIFLTTLKSLVPEVEISYNKSDYETEDNISKNIEKEFYKEKIDGEKDFRNLSKRDYFDKTSVNDSRRASRTDKNCRAAERNLPRNRFEHN